MGASDLACAPSARSEWESSLGGLSLLLLWGFGTN
jgi:hypothetical protein